MNQPIAQEAYGVLIPSSTHELKRLIEEFQHQWHGYAEGVPMIEALETILREREQSA